MRKRDELAQTTSCLNKAGNDELIFVLLGRDIAAAETIRFWARQRCFLQKNKFEDPQIVEAMKLATEIEEELQEMKKVTR